MRKITSRFLLLITMAMFLSCSVSNTDIGKRKITDAKGVALCHCLKFLNVQADSLSIMTKDVSISYFVEFSPLSLEQIIEIRKFTEQNIDSFVGISKNPDHNMIGFSCWQFHKSDELDLFVKDVLKKKQNE